MVEQTHLYRDYQNQEYHEDKVHPKVLSISKATRPSRRLICSLLFLSVHAIPEKLAQRLLVSGLSAGQSPFSLLLFLRHWASLSLGWSMMNITIPSDLCLYRAGSVFGGLCRKAIRYFARPETPARVGGGSPVETYSLSPPRCARGSRNNEQSNKNV